MKEPGPEHPINISPVSSRVTVKAGGAVIAASDNALIMQESTYPPVYYLPRADAAMDALAASDHGSYCPYKGDASYFSIPALGADGANAVWSYESPYPAVAEIVGHLAFYSDKVDISVES